MVSFTNKSSDYVKKKSHDVRTSLGEISQRCESSVVADVVILSSSCLTGICFVSAVPYVAFMGCIYTSFETYYYYQKLGNLNIDAFLTLSSKKYLYGSTVVFGAVVVTAPFTSVVASILIMSITMSLQLAVRHCYETELQLVISKKEAELKKVTQERDEAREEQLNLNRELAEQRVGKGSLSEKIIALSDKIEILKAQMLAGVSELTLEELREQQGKLEEDKSNLEIKTSSSECILQKYLLSVQLIGEGEGLEPVSLIEKLQLYLNKNQRDRLSLAGKLDALEKEWQTTKETSDSSLFTTVKASVVAGGGAGMMGGPAGAFLGALGGAITGAVTACNSEPSDTMSHADYTSQKKSLEARVVTLKDSEPKERAVTQTLKEYTESVSSLTAINAELDVIGLAITAQEKISELEVQQAKYEAEISEYKAQLAENQKYINYLETKLQGSEALIKKLSANQAQYNTSISELHDESSSDFYSEKVKPRWESFQARISGFNESYMGVS